MNLVVIDNLVFVKIVKLFVDSLLINFCINCFLFIKFFYFFVFIVFVEIWGNRIFLSISK